MRALLSIASVLALAGLASAQWSDDFNRPDGPIGGNWNVVSGSWAIANNQGTHTSAPAHEYIEHTLASGTYDSSVVSLDAFALGSSSQFSAVLIGVGGADMIQVKLQDQVSGTPGFSHIGIYHRVGSNWGAWTGTGTGFAALQAPFLSARLKVYFSDPDTLIAEVDTDFDGNPDQVYTKDGVTTISSGFGTGYGIMGWGSTAVFDNWSVGGGGPPPIVTYCTAGTTTNGCVPAISANNQPSLTQATPCDITVTGVEGQKSGLIFYGVDNTGFTPLNWGSGGHSFLCVKAPTQRTATQSSGGTLGMCDGSLTLDWNAFQLANPASLGNPWSAGDSVFAQGWFRDPPAVKTTNLSDAVQLIYVP